MSDIHCITVLESLSTKSGKKHLKIYHCVASGFSGRSGVKKISNI